MIGSYYCFDNPSALNKQLQHYWTSLVRADRNLPTNPHLSLQ